MTSMQNKLQNFGAGLADIVPKTYHYWRATTDIPYCIWAEDGEDESLSTGNKKTEQQIHGTIDYFTQSEYDPKVDAIQEYLNDREDTGWRLNGVTYEDDTHLIHYEWEFWVA